MNRCPRTFDEATWYVNGTLSTTARRNYDAHLLECAECRNAVALDRRLAETIAARASRVLPAPQTAWSRLQEKLEPAEASSGLPEGRSGTPQGGRRRTARRRHRLLQLAIAAQAAAILVLIATLWVSLSPAPVRTFRTLGSSDPSYASSEPLLRVVVAAGLPPSAVHEIAASAGAELRERVEGTDIYTLAVTIPAGQSRAGRVASALASLREREDVLMAEPITDPQVTNGQQ